MAAPHVAGKEHDKLVWTICALYYVYLVLFMVVLSCVTLSYIYCFLVFRLLSDNRRRIGVMVNISRLY